MAPFIAPLFFAGQDPLTALILTYGMLAVGIISRPFGSLFFGWLGDRYGRRNALCFSLLGMAFVTVSIGCLPVYDTIGLWSPILLALARMLQNFCAVGESIGGAIFVLEHTENQKRTFISSLYDASSILGILVASALVTFFSIQGYMEKGWRILFWIGGASAIIGIFLRLQASEGHEFLHASKPKRHNLFKVLYQHHKILFALTLAAGFSYTTYSLAFTLMNGFIPLITTFSKADVMKVNTGLLVVDMALLPCFGFLANKFGKEKLMFAAAFCCLVVSLPLFALLAHGSWFLIIFVRFILVMLGVAFAASYHAWALQKVPVQHRYTILSLGYALGSQLMGAPTAAISLWLYKKMQWTAAPGLYLMFIAAFAAYVVKYFGKDVITAKTV